MKTSEFTLDFNDDKISIRNDLLRTYASTSL